MKNTLVLWKEIISNPFEGYGKVNNSTKLFPPMLIVIILLLISTSMIVPIMTSDAYADAVARVQINALAERGTEMSDEQKAAVVNQIKSPMFRNITLASAYAGGVITFLLITLIVSFILKLIVSAVKKEKVSFSLVLKIIFFASLVSMVQSLVKMGITLGGDWQRVLARVTDTTGLQMALQSPVSLAALLDVSSVGRQVYFLADYATDIFNWIYYILLYAGLKVSVGLEKKPALIITIVTAILSMVVALMFTFIG